MTTTIRREEARCTRFESGSGRSLIRALEGFDIELLNPHSMIEGMEVPFIAIVVTNTFQAEGLGGAHVDGAVLFFVAAPGEKPLYHTTLTFRFTRTT